MELNNPQDPFAMAVMKDDSNGNGSTVVGHVPRAVTGNPMRVPVLWTPGLHRKTQEPFAVAKNITDRC
jgi:hypothetical protein